jgi:hypothetical protein
MDIGEHAFRDRRNSAFAGVCRPRPPPFQILEDGRGGRDCRISPDGTMIAPFSRPGKPADDIFAPFRLSMEIPGIGGDQPVPNL